MCFPFYLVVLKNISWLVLLTLEYVCISDFSLSDIFVNTFVEILILFSFLLKLLKGLGLLV